MSAILTALPFPTRPWETAKAQFLEQLTPEEKQCFESATLENIFYQTSAAQKRHANGSNSWAMQERISSLVDAIEEYGKALDVYANAFPLVLSPLWGSIRVILKIAGETGRFQEKIVDMLASIGDALPRFQIYEILFRNHERLLKAISTAYLDVLRFCVKAKQFFGHGKKLPLPMSIGCRGLWKPFRQEFDKYMSDFRKHRKHVEKEASLAHMIESARRREIELANHALQKRNGMVNKRHRYMSLLQVVDYQSKQKTLANLRFQGTNTWLQASTPYMEWLNSPISTCLCCYGIPGSGKSVLASSVVDMLGQINEPSSILCYYYFDHADVRSLDMNYLLGSLIRQVLTNLPLTEFGDDSEIPMDDYASISLGEKLRLYVKLLRRFPQAFIVLDGLDELGHDCQVSTLDLIKSLVQERLPVVRLYVTCREGEHLVRKTLRSHNSFKLSSPQVSSDISLFIEGALDSAANHNPILSNLQLHKEVRDALLHGANGMFLWVKFQLYDICEALSAEALHTTINNLPKDLCETYARIIRKIYNSPGGVMKVETMKKVLRWVSCAYRPLHIEELEEAVGLLKDDKIWPAERIVTGSGEKLVHACGHLVVYNRDDHTVTLAHPTVRQFLCSSSSSPEDSVPASIKFDMAEADTDIGEICVAYLNFSDLETQLIQVTPPTTMGRRQAERIVWKGVPLAPFLKGIMNRGRADDPFDSGTNVKDITYEFPRPKPTQNPTTKFSLLPYVIEYWAFHASGFTPELSCWEAFAHLTFHRNLLFQFRPWELTRSTNIVPADELVMPLYTWSMQHGIWSFVRLLVWNIDTYRLLKLHIHRRAMDLKVDPDWLFDDFLTLRFNLHVGRKAIHSCWSDNGTFWTCDDIYNIASQFQSDSRAVAFLRFLKTELETLGHSAGSGLLSKAFNGAMRLAISKLDVLTWRTLCQACISSFKQLSHAIVSFFQQHQHRPLSVPSIFGTFFSIDIGNDWPQFVDIALLKTLYVYLPEIEGAIAWKYINPKEMSQQCIWLLLVLAFTSISGSLSTIEVLLKHITGTALNFEFHRSKPERTTVASQSFVSLEGPSLLGMLFQCLRNSPISISKTKMKMIFEALNLNRFGRLPINSLEKKGIHCLAWAAELDMSDVVAQLMPHYQDQLRDCNEVYMTGSMGINVGVLSLSAAIGHSEDSLTEMLQWSWPHHVVHAVLEHPKVKSLKPINRRALEDMSKYPSIRPSRPQPLWPAVPEEAQED